MFSGIVITVSVVGTLLLALGTFIKRGHQGVDLSPRSLWRVYLLLVVRDLRRGSA